METIKTLLPDIEYYIWWLLNCSQRVNPERIKNEVDSLIIILNKEYLKTGNYYSELNILEEIRLYDYDVISYKYFENLIKT